jgi:hypothetical protein
MDGTREQRPEATRRAEAAPPTARQIYALAAALCERAGEPFPDRRDDASELIERVRREIGHPAPRLEDTPRLDRRRRGRRRVRAT